MATSSSHNKISQRIIKATGLFGGTQILSILCSIIRAKAISLFIGPAGVGLLAVWTSAIEMICSASNNGLRNSCVRDVANAKTASRVSLIVTVIRRFTLWLALALAAFSIFASPLLSHISFGDFSHFYGFILLAIVILVNTLTNSEHAILQGSSRLKSIAKISIFSSIATIVVTVPLFYFFKENSILPAIIIGYLIAYATTLYYRNTDISATAVTAKTVWNEGSTFIKFGIFMTIGISATTLTNYIFISYLNAYAGTSEVGLYQAGYSMVNRYAGLVLAALGMEYFPRLSSVASSKLRTKIFVSQEIHISLLILTPIITIFMLLRSLIIEILYSSEFLSIANLVMWLLLGMLLRTISWCIAYVMYAKADGKTVLITEVISSCIGLGLNILFYNLMGITGIGISFALWYAIYIIIVSVVYFGKYHLALAPAVAYSIIASINATALVMVAIFYQQLALAIISTLIICIFCATKLIKLFR